MTNQALDNWAKESIPLLRQYGYIDDNSYKLFWILVISVLGLSFLVLGYYGGSQGWLKSSNNQTVILEPETIINNSYLFAPVSDNEYMFTIINNITIPEDWCE